jgi:rubrerythrin
MNESPCQIVQALKDAVQMEIDGQKFYEKAALAAANPGTKEIFDYLAESEKYHIVKIQEIYQALEKDKSLNESLCAFVQPYQRPNVFSEILARAPMGQSDANDMEAINRGIEMEEKSIDYYVKLAKESKDPFERRFLLSLVNEERGHYLFLVDYRNFLTDPADWYHITERQMVDGA